MEKIYWTKQTGEKILVDDMSLEHLRNTLKMIIRKRKPIKRIPKFALAGDMANEFNDMQDLSNYEFDMGIDME